MIETLLNYIFPPVCGICGKIDKNYLCNKCKNKLKNIELYNIENYSGTTSFFDEHIYMFQYTGYIRDAILNYKFQDKSYINEMFITFLKSNKIICNKLMEYDIIIPVPISKKRFKQRGYNQSAILAKKISKILQKEYSEKVLIKKQDNKPQSSLTQEERNTNVIGVYQILNKTQLIAKKVLLIDDIFTTGNTINECSKILKQNGANKVGAFTIAKD